MSGVDERVERAKRSLESLRLAARIDPVLKGWCDDVAAAVAGLKQRADEALVDLGISRDEYLEAFAETGVLRERAEAAEQRADEAEKALRRIAYMPFDVMVDAHDDLRDCKAIAHLALAAAVVSAEPTP